jgi:hypothetical protein
MEENKAKFDKMTREIKIGVIAFVTLISCVLITLFYFIFTTATFNVPVLILYISIGLFVCAVLFMIYVIWLYFRRKKIKESIGVPVVESKTTDQ